MTGFQIFVAVGVDRIENPWPKPLPTLTHEGEVFPRMWKYYPRWMTDEFRIPSKGNKILCIRADGDDSKYGFARGKWWIVGLPFEPCRPVMRKRAAQLTNIAAESGWFGMPSAAESDYAECLKAAGWI
jgi:hypothetical protein